MLILAMQNHIISYQSYTMKLFHQSYDTARYHCKYCGSWQLSHEGPKCLLISLPLAVDRDSYRMRDRNVCWFHSLWLWIVTVIAWGTEMFADFTPSGCGSWQVPHEGPKCLLISLPLVSLWSHPLSMYTCIFIIYFSPINYVYMYIHYLLLTH